MTVRIGQHFELLSYETSSVPYPSASRHEVHCLSCVQIPYTTDMYFNCKYIKSCLDFITKHQVTTGGGDMAAVWENTPQTTDVVPSPAVGAVALQPLSLLSVQCRAHGAEAEGPHSLTLGSLCCFPLTLIVGML